MKHLGGGLKRFKLNDNEEYELIYENESPFAITAFYNIRFDRLGFNYQDYKKFIIVWLFSPVDQTEFEDNYNSWAYTYELKPYEPSFKLASDLGFHKWITVDYTLNTNSIMHHETHLTFNKNNNGNIWVYMPNSYFIDSNGVTQETSHYYKHFTFYRLYGVK